ncbi:MAG: class I SAM-dependent methyltransferase [Emergencia sp.]|nr:class I SAM-dependent methyltransferase [Emergencia sp.]
MKLSERLQLIADEIKTGETMADIGTDHGFLPLYLLENHISPKVIMADISSGSLAKAGENCKLAKAKGDFELRLGNGIDVLKDGEVDVVVMAGIGGLLTIDMLQWNLAKSRSLKRYILQPRNKPGILRHWLYCNGFSIVKESLVRESKFIWEIFTVESGIAPSADRKNTPYDETFDFPDELLTFGNDLTEAYLQKKLELQHMIYRNIAENGNEAENAAKPVLARIRRIEFLLEEWERRHGER